MQIRARDLAAFSRAISFFFSVQHCINHSRKWRVIKMVMRLLFGAHARRASVLNNVRRPLSLWLVKKKVFTLTARVTRYAYARTLKLW